MNFLNIGILAHVDAGKTSLTERLLFNAGVIDHIGSVDCGDTQTDSLALERQRGITIKTAAVSFAMGNTTINLLDTPGHPDFIAEVERVLSVLDGAVLVISAVEGVQAQTRILMRTLQRLGIPTIIFVNKIDRRGARYDHLLNDIASKLVPNIAAMGTVSNIGTPHADFAPYQLDPQATAGMCPVFAGSAITGAGVQTLATQLTQLFPKASGSGNGQLNGRVFKVERGQSGEKIAYVRMFAGAVHPRDVLPCGKITALQVFQNGATTRTNRLVAGQIGKIWGLGNIQVGDGIGESNMHTEHYFAPPTLETAVTPRVATDKTALYAALAQLAEQDPLINLRQDDVRQELYVSLYGEVQKEVIQATLATDFGIAAQFSKTTTVYVERPIGSGSAVEVIDTPSNPFKATVGLRVEPAPLNSGVQYNLAQNVLGTMPLAFFKAIEETVYSTLQQGLLGWQVLDCVVTLTHTGYWPRQSHSHGTFDKNMSSTAGDFRNLTPLVLMDALQRARTIVCQPLQHFGLEIPKDTLSTVLQVLAKHDAIVQATNAQHATYLLSGTIPAARVHSLQHQLPALTSGEGVFEYAFDSYQAVHGEAPRRTRTDLNPLDRREYLLRVAKGA